MVRVQCVLTIGLALISLIVQKQYDHLQNTDTGFNKENPLALLITRKMRNDIEQVKRHFQDYYNGSYRMFWCTRWNSGRDAVSIPDLNNENHSVSAFIVDEDHILVMDMRLVARRNFKCRY